MDELYWRERLENEGYENIEVIRDDAGKEYGNHTHAATMVHVILQGDMELIMDGDPVMLRAGDKIEVASGMVHSAKVGEEGCVYMTGEK
jgi:quercetin dioxygenase-like cupin family protein